MRAITTAVVRRFFARGTSSILVVGHVVYQRASLFRALTQRMENIRELDAKLFLKITALPQFTHFIGAVQNSLLYLAE